MQKYSNNGISSLAVEKLIGATAIQLKAGEGDKLNVIASPDFQMLTIILGVKVEIVKVTARTMGSDILTIEEAQEGTIAQDFPAGAIVRATLTAGTIEKLIDSRISKIIAGLNANAPGDKYISIGENAGPPDLADAPARANTTAYAAGDYVVQSPFLLRCHKAGTSGASAPTLSGTGAFMADGDIIWLTLVGYDDDGINMGNGSWVSNSSGFALGKGAGGLGSAMGEDSFANFRSTALSMRAFVADKNAMSLGYDAHNYGPRYSLKCTAVPVSKNVFDWNFGDEHSYNTVLTGSISSEPVDLSGGETWAAATAYNHGSVIQPTTPNGCQYVLYDSNFNRLDDPTLLLYTPSNSGGSEPTWTTGYLDQIDDGVHGWVCVPNDGSYAVGCSTDFMVEEVLFICLEATAVTVQPSISIGTTGDLTKIINNQAATGLTADKTVTRWTLTNPVIVPDITIKIDTLATATKLLGYFMFKGVYVENGNK